MSSECDFVYVEDDDSVDDIVEILSFGGDVDSECTDVAACTVRNALDANELIKGGECTELTLISFAGKFNVFRNTVVTLAEKNKPVTLRYIVDNFRNGRRAAFEALKTLVSEKKTNAASIVALAMGQFSYHEIYGLLKTYSGALFLRETFAPVSYDVAMYCCLRGDREAIRNLKDVFGVDVDTVGGLLTSIPIVGASIFIMALSKFIPIMKTY